MKIIFRNIQLFALASAFALVSCKKETQTVSDTVPAADSAAQIGAENPTLTNTAASLTEWKADKVDALLKKNNDTLYVTNFFATWCGPCMKEIPHFKEKMASLSGQPVKFTFVSLDDKTDWNEAVKNFAEENQLQNHIVLLDGNTLDETFFRNFKNWKGESIPFTFMRKGEKTDETVGMMSKEDLDAKIKSFGF